MWLKILSLVPENNHSNNSIHFCGHLLGAYGYKIIYNLPLKFNKPLQGTTLIFVGNWGEVKFVTCPGIHSEWGSLDSNLDFLAAKLALLALGHPADRLNKHVRQLGRNY